MDPFVIYTLPRTGSTTLLKLLNCHPAVRCVFEPFNPDNAADYAKRCRQIVRTYGLDSALRALWTACNGLKHVWRVGGWPFVESQHSQPDRNSAPAIPGGHINRQLLLSGARIVLLTRRNALRRAISEQLSEQMGLWVFQNESDRQRISSHQPGPLDINRLRTAMAEDRAATQWVRDQLAAANARWTELSYEDLFGGTLECRMDQAQNLLGWLGAGRLTQTVRLKEMERLFDPAVSGFENALVYERIPNIHSVNRELGCPDTGQVFE